MGNSKFYRKTSDLKRTLVVSGLALASFVVPTTLSGENEATQVLPVDNQNLDGVDADGIEGAEIKTQEVLAGVTRGGLGYAYYEERADEVIDPLSPWGPSPPMPDTDTDDDIFFYPPGYYGGIWFIGGYTRPFGYVNQRIFNRHGGHGVGQ